MEIIAVRPETVKKLCLVPSICDTIPKKTFILSLRTPSDDTKVGPPLKARKRTGRICKRTRSTTDTTPDNVGSQPKS